MSSKTSLLIRQYEIGPLNNFLYLLGDPATKEMAIVDPAWDVDFLREEAKRLGYVITQVFLTHAHPDHINGLDQLLALYKLPVYISKHEAPFLTAQIQTKQSLTGIEDRARLKLGHITFDVLHTPGHTPGCQCFLAQNNLICGDTLFIDGCGRCDLPGGDARVMYQSLTNVIMKLPGDTVVYPGHNYGPAPTDTIGHQKQTNPYLQSASVEEFLSERMGM
ncbi:MAG: MBL fold metallo-hydrolase [Candidatus Omnitrophica bacterium]|nr:MBL fold metallo-hydrolase [Candidatus Omnitrophota bacterium]